MSVDDALIELVRDRKYDPWRSVPKSQIDCPMDRVFLSCPEIERCKGAVLIGNSVWIGYVAAQTPDPGSGVLIKHMRIQTNYETGSEYPQKFVTSFYKVVKAFELGGSHPDQRRVIQGIIDNERAFKNEVSIVFDGTAAGRSLEGDWRQALRNMNYMRTVTKRAGEPKKIKETSISDLLTTAVSAFEQSRVGIPKHPGEDQQSFIRKLEFQLRTKPVGLNGKGQLKAIDEGDPNQYNLAIALSLVVGFNEVLDSQAALMMVV